MSVNGSSAKDALRRRPVFNPGRRDLARELQQSSEESKRLREQAARASGSTVLRWR